MVALELITGQRQWELNIAGISTPWVAGDWVFVVTDEAQADLRLAPRTARSAGSTSCRSSRRRRRRRARSTIPGPVLAGGRLILAGSNGTLINVDPATGASRARPASARAISLPPVVANSTLYVLDDDGRLHAFR